MPDVVVHILAATICFSGTCHPALVGTDTPIGTFNITHYSTRRPGYGGDILSYKEDPKYVWAIHRVLDIKGQHRLERIKSNDPKDRVITLGCINVEPEVYKELVELDPTTLEIEN